MKLATYSEMKAAWPSQGRHILASHNGSPLPRRAVQLGLRGEMLRRYAESEVIKIEDISGFVAEQREFIQEPDKLMVPAETIYRPRRTDAAKNVMLDECETEPVS